MEAQPHRYKSLHMLYQVTFNICLSTFNFGYCVVYFNSLLMSEIVVIYDLSADEAALFQGIITGFISLFGGFGAFFSSYLMNHFSRRQCFFILEIAMILVCLTLMIPNIKVLLICRLIQGIVIGMISAVAPLYIREFVPNEVSGLLGPWNALGIVIGITFPFLLSLIFGWILPFQIYWRMIFILPLITSTIQFYNLIYKFPYETPKWLILNNKLPEAKDLLKTIYKDQYVEDVYKEICKLLENQKCRQSTISFSEKDLPNFGPQTPKHQKQTQLKHLKETLIEEKKQIKTNKLAIFTAFHLHILQQMCGMGILIAYSGEVIHQIAPSIMKLYPILINGLCVFGGLYSGRFLKANGRYQTIQFGCLWVAILLLIIGVILQNLNNQNVKETSLVVKILICLIFIVIRFIFAMSMGPAVWVYNSEVVQPKFLSYSTAISWLFLSLLNTIFPIVKQWLGGNCGPIFCFFGLYTLGSYFLNRKIVIQTEGKTEYEINKEYDIKLKGLIG